MHIYVKKFPTIESKLRVLSNRLYGGAYAKKGLTDFYYAFTVSTRFQGEECSEINFEILGTQKQIAFLTLIDEDFKVIGVESPKGGEREEHEAMEWWRRICST